MIPTLLRASDAEPEDVVLWADDLGAGEWWRGKATKTLISEGCVLDNGVDDGLIETHPGTPDFARAEGFRATSKRIAPPTLGGMGF